MELIVRSLAFYRTTVDPPWGDRDWLSNVLIKCVKGKPWPDHWRSPIKIWTHRLSRTGDIEQHQDVATTITTKRIAQPLRTYLEKVAPGQTIVFVPIPAKEAIVDGPIVDYGPKLFATKLAQDLGGVCLEMLKWTEPRPKSHEMPGESRDAAEHLRYMAVVEAAVEGACYILVDDVFTTGSQMKACSSLLHSIGATPTLGLCVGQTTHEDMGDRTLKGEASTIEYKLLSDYM